MKKIILGLIAILVSATIFAAPRTVEQAAQLAAEFTNTQPQFSHIRKSTRPAASLRLAHTVAKPASTEAAFYIFNQPDNGGWVIISADDNARTVLGYSTEGAFNAARIPSNVQFWFDYQAERVAAAKPTSKVKKAVATTYVPVAPLLGLIKWGQDAPYNDDCPMDTYDDTRCATGCVATAAAQIMYFWKWPAQGKGGEKEYTWKNEVGTQGTEKVNFSNATYDWANMIDNYSTREYTTAQAKAVSKLMYHVGVSCEMEYGGDDCGGSAAYTDDMMNGLVTYFDYKSEAKYTSTSGSVPSGLGTTFYNELKVGRPVLMGGSTTKREGHEFVCDGVDKDGFFHINWGWDGTSNGFFALSALDPEQQGTGGASSGQGFANSVDYVTKLHPNKSSESLTSVAVSPASLNLSIKEKKQIVPVFTPELATNRAMYWTSEDESIATVSCDGIVIGVSQGTTRIIATTYDGSKTGFCTVTVSNEAYTGIQLVVDEAMAKYDSDYSLPWALKVYDKTTEEPWINFNFSSGSSNKIAGIYDLGSSTYYWPDASNDNKIITSVSGTLIVTLVGEKDGASGCNTYHIQANFEADDLNTYSVNATLEVCAKNANNNVITLTDVLPIAVTGVTVSPDTKTIDINEKFTLTATVAPSNASIPNVTWSSNHPEIATVDENGRVTGKSQGTATITATTLDGGFTDDAIIVVTDQVAVIDATFTLLTDANDLEAGDEIILVCKSKSKAGSAIQSNNSASFFSTADVTISSNTIDLSDNTSVVRMTVGGSKGAWTFANPAGQLLGATAEKKVSWGGTKTKWSISIVSGGDATIQNETSSYGRFLYNVNSPRFVPYGSNTKTSSTMLLPQIFIHKGPSTVPTSIEECPTIGNPSTAIKQIVNGQLVIIVDGKKYNAFGQTIE